MVDKYKNVFEKGADNYIELLETINWFDNPYLEKKEIIKDIKECDFLPYLATTLVQTRHVLDFFGAEQIKYMLESLKEDIIKDLKFKMSNNILKLELNGCIEVLEIPLDDFEVGEGEDSFISRFINPFIKKAGISYQFFNMPPDDENASLIFVKENTYREAIEIGVIPDFIGYFAVNY